MIVSLIAAATPTGAIGYRRALPWGRALKEDLHRFKAHTRHYPCIVGRKTWERLPPLPDRRLLVLTRYTNAYDSGAYAFCPSLEVALRAAGACHQQRTPRTCIIGGAQVYTEALEHGIVGEAHITRVWWDGPVDVECPALTRKSLERAGLVLMSTMERRETEGAPYHVFEHWRAL